MKNAVELISKIQENQGTPEKILTPSTMDTMLPTQRFEHEIRFLLNHCFSKLNDRKNEIEL